MLVNVNQNPGVFKSGISSIHRRRGTLVMTSIPSRRRDRFAGVMEMNTIKPEVLSLI